MTTDVDLDEVARRPVRYWNVDGIPELMMGVLWMVWGAAWLFGESLPDSARRQTYWAFTPVLLVLSGFASVWATKKLKARLTFPRTGYVSWKAPGAGARWGTAAASMVTALVLAAAIVLMRDGAPRGEQSAAPVVTVILSLAFVVASVRQRAPHYLALAAVAAALALALASLRAPWESLNRVFVLLGAATATVGALRLALFMRKHPRAPAEGL